MLRYAWTRPEDESGTLSITVAAPKASIERDLGHPFADDAEYEAFVLSRSIPPEGTNVQKLPDDWSPPDRDRTYRNAWRQNGPGVTVDMPRARNIHRDLLRAEREPLLKELDLAYLRADERGDTEAKTQIVAEKETLRNVTAMPEIEAAQSPNELRAIIPPWKTGVAIVR